MKKGGTMRPILSLTVFIIIALLLLGAAANVEPVDAGQFQSPFLSPLARPRPLPWLRWIEPPIVCEGCGP